ncbi:MAG: hypothetical protein WBG37_19515, partial [Desulfobacterales bacterium]
MSLVLIQVDDENFTRDPSNTVPLQIFPDIETWEKSNTEPTAFILGVRDKARIVTLLKRLRSTPRTALKPIFLSTSMDQELDSLSDGVVNSPAEAETRAKAINHKLAELDRSLIEDPREHTFRLLGYLFTRP